ncbi:MAG TPA: ABC transporter substrate-binding protein [Pedobacter sp.]|uniref:heme/hemin ABC transporter substrate-binding protein n=1 Tax=Pedobacter sp. TaxID=1411316 RepID=UPI002D159913|nr:ABC transporter substrate-binding protein [Pedobacter sp.]HMI02675.1 ABC transporter substrate-binding protein [Pedobacter sp.]
MKKHLLIVLLALSITACTRFKNKSQDGISQRRIVCISKQYNEIMYALGAQNDLVAVDISSVYPPAIKKLPTVGYHRALSLEAILANKPDIILEEGPESMGPEHVVSQLKQLKIPMVQFKTKATNIDSTKLLIKEMGSYFKKLDMVNSLCKKLDSDMIKALDNAKKYHNKPKVLVIHFGQASNVYMVMSKKSLAAKIVSWAGGEMAVDDVKGMRQISAEVVAKSNPDVIILTDFGYDRLGSYEKIGELPGAASTKAFKNKQVFRFEENNLVYLGPRTGENVLKLQKLIHQDEQAQ